MAKFARKNSMPLGIDTNAPKDISAVASTDTGWLNKILYKIKTWCNDTFAAASHGTHVTASTCVTSVNGSKGAVTISASSLGVMGMPNFSNKTIIVDESDSNKKDNSNHVIRSTNGYTIPSDGWLLFDSRGHDDATSKLYINGALWFCQNNDYGSMGVHVFMPVPKNTKVKYQGDSGSIKRAWFFPI